MEAAATCVQFANRLADMARPIAQKYFRSRLSVEAKIDASPVTQADREIEAALRAAIRSTFSEDGILGEEEGGFELQRQRVWVIDPIDGTKSFITGMPTFGTLIALLDGGVPVLGVIDMPMLDERWVGQANEATTLNGVVCCTSDVTRLGEATLFATSPDMFRGDAAAAFQSVSAAVALRRFGGDCYAYGLLSSGHVDTVVEANLKPYDYLALVPVIQGAGGVITDWEGVPLGLHSNGNVVAAANPALHAQLLSCLYEHKRL